MLYCQNDELRIHDSQKQHMSEYALNRVNQYEYRTNHYILQLPSSHIRTEIYNQNICNRPYGWYLTKFKDKNWKKFRILYRMHIINH